MGKASFTMGLFGITEGAIPFAQDPLRVIPSIMAGSMTGAVIAMIGNVGDRVAHGGPIVAVLGAVDNVFMFFVAIIVGSLVTAVIVNVLKKDISKVEETQEMKEVSTTKEVAEVQEQVIEKKKVEIQKLTDITSLELIDINLVGETRDDIIDEMIGKLNAVGVLHSDSEFKQAIMSREAEQYRYWNEYCDSSWEVGCSKTECCIWN